MSEALEIHTNGRYRVNWTAIVGVLWSLLLGVLIWNAKQYDGRIERLEDASSTIKVTASLREQDRQTLDRIEEEQRRVARLMSKMAAKLGVEE